MPELCLLGKKPHSSIGIYDCEQNSIAAFIRDTKIWPSKSEGTENAKACGHTHSTPPQASAAQKKRESQRHLPNPGEKMKYDAERHAD